MKHFCFICHKSIDDPSHMSTHPETKAYQTLFSLGQYHVINCIYGIVQSSWGRNKVAALQTSRDLNRFVSRHRKSA